MTETQCRGWVIWKVPCGSMSMLIYPLAVQPPQHYPRTHITSTRLGPVPKNGQSFSHSTLEVVHWGAHVAYPASPPKPTGMIIHRYCAKPTIFHNLIWGEWWHEMNEWGYEMTWSVGDWKWRMLVGWKWGNGKIKKIPTHIITVVSPGDTETLTRDPSRYRRARSNRSQSETTLVAYTVYYTEEDIYSICMDKTKYYNELL